MAAMVLVVDDDANVRDTIRDLLTLEGIPVLAVGPDVDLDALLEREPIGVVVTDLNMPHVHGTEIVARVRRVAEARGVTIPVFVLTGAGGEGTLETTISEGAAGYFPKPFDIDVFTETIRSALARSSP